MTRLNFKPRPAAAPPTYYATLGVAPGASTERIHKAYLARAFKLHPDRNGGKDDEFKAVALAWGTLKNAELRARYDARLRLERRACRECAGAGLVKKSSGFTTVKEVECRTCKGAGYV